MEKRLKIKQKTLKHIREMTRNICRIHSALMKTAR